MFYSCKKTISRRILYFPLRSSHLLYYPGIQFGYNTLLFNFRTIICQVVTYGRSKTKENFKLLALKWLRSLSRGSRLQEVANVVIWLKNFWYFGKLVTEERWSLTRGGCNQKFDCSIILLQCLQTLSIIMQTADSTNCYWFFHLE